MQINLGVDPAEMRFGKSFPGGRVILNATPVRRSVRMMK